LLFDDVIEASAVDLEFEHVEPAARDTRLGERARTGDSVVRVRVETFTTQGDEKHPRYELRNCRRTFIAFVRQFVRPDGELEFRFHLSKDDAAVNAAVRRAVEGSRRTPAQRKNETGGLVNHGSTD
jgi:hypothetical protein